MISSTEETLPLRDHRCSRLSAFEILDDWSEQTESEISFPHGSDWNPSYYRLLENVSAESWKKRLISQNMTLCPLQFSKPSVEQWYLRIRVPLLRERLTVLVVYHVLVTTALVFIISSFGGWNKDAIMINLSSTMWTHLAIFVFQIIVLCSALSSLTVIYMMPLLSNQCLFCIETFPSWVVAGVSESCC